MITYRAAPEYQTIATDRYDLPLSAVVARCNALENERNNGYCVTAWADGRILADSEGICVSSRYSTDAATATGMYDR